MSEKIKAIRGNRERTEEVKKWLTSQGAINASSFDCTYEDYAYYVRSNHRINYFIYDSYAELFDIVELPELPTKPTLKVIKGDFNRGAEVIKTLEELGGKNVGRLSGYDELSYYFINLDCKIDSYTVGHFYFNNYELEILELPEKESDIFKPFDKVLVRNKKSTRWECDIFSHYSEEDDYPHVCIGGTWKECIPYEGNEDLVGSY